MKDLKTAFSMFVTVIAGIVGGIIPIFYAYQLWVWAMEQIPVSNEWAGLIKVGVTLGMIFFGGGATVVIAFLFGLAAATATGFITGLLR